MGRLTIDQRLSDVLNFLCEQEGINPQTYESQRGSRLFSKNEEDIKSLKATIDYLKDYAKLQTIAKSMSNSKGLAEDIEKAKADFEALIEERKKQIASMPIPKKRSSASFMYDYVDKFNEAEARRVEEEKEERARKIASLKQDIKIYQGKIKKLNEVKKHLSNPQKVMEILLPNEYTNVKENYARLINLCAASMVEGFRKSELIGEDKPFNYEDGKYTVNYNNARKFLSVLKAKNQVMSATDFIGKKQEYVRTADTRRKRQEYIGELNNAVEASKTEEFDYIVARMNMISDMYMDLEEMEAKARKGTIFTRIANGIRHAFGYRRRGAKIPRKVWDARFDLADEIKALTAEVKHNPELEDAFNAYQLATKDPKSSVFRGIKEFAWNAEQLKQFGVERVYLPQSLVHAEDLRKHLTKELRVEQRELALDKKEEQEAKHTALDSYVGLTKRTKSVLKKQEDDTIVRIAEEYYGLGKENDRLGIRREGRIAPSTAAIILESILGRKNISWEQIANSYAEVLGRDNIDIEELDLEKAVDNKVDSLRKYFANAATRETETER